MTAKLSDVMFLFVLWFYCAKAVYFTMNNVISTIPIDKKLFSSQNNLLITFSALGDPPVEYFTNEDKFLRISKNGEVYFSKKNFDSNLTDVIDITTWITARDSSTNENVTLLKLELFPSQTLDCDHIVEDLCFWKSAQYRIFENTKPTVLGSLASPYLFKLCPTYLVTYNLLSKTHDFRLVDWKDQLSIETTKPLEREIKSQYSLEMLCTVKNFYNQSIRNITKNVAVTVLGNEENPTQTKKPGFNLKVNSGLSLAVSHNFSTGFFGSIPSIFDVGAEYSLDQNKPHIYPSKKVKIFRTAAPFARLIQPNPKNINDAKQFTLTSRNPKVFNVTSVGGILFVQDYRKLKKSRGYLSVNISWIRNNRREFEEIQIQVLDGPSTTCANVTRFTEWSSCSLYTTRKSCFESKNCALGTLGSSSVGRWKGHRCMWKNSRHSFIETTCTPDIDTCPDGTCDELEKLHDGICPQDCTSEPVTEPTVLTEPSVVNGSPTVTEPSVVTKPVEINNVSEPFLVFLGVIFSGGAMAIIAICWRLKRFCKANRNSLNRKSEALSTSKLSTTTSLVYSTISNNTNKLQEQVDSKWEFPRNQVTIQKTLGEGEFGKVLLAEALNIADQKGQTAVAVKTLKEGATESELKDLLSEYKLLKELSHPNVIRLLGVCTTSDGPVYLITELAEYGSLRNYLRRSRGVTKCETGGNDSYEVTPQEIWSFASQICKGMIYLSNIKLVHRDLASRNILLTVDKICKISDFGLTRDIYEDDVYFKRSKGKVPIKWMAPESISDQIYTSKSDVWSFGVLLWELVTLGVTPYPGIPVEKLFYLICLGYRMKRPDNCSSALYDIMRRCWSKEPEERPTFQELVKILENIAILPTSEENLRKSKVTRKYSSHLQHYVRFAEKWHTAEEADNNKSNVEVNICGYVSR